MQVCKVVIPKGVGEIIMMPAFMSPQLFLLSSYYSRGGLYPISESGSLVYSV